MSLKGMLCHLCDAWCWVLITYLIPSLPLSQMWPPRTGVGVSQPLGECQAMRGEPHVTLGENSFVFFLFFTNRNENVFSYYSSPFWILQLTKKKIRSSISLWYMMPNSLIYPVILFSFLFSGCQCAHRLLVDPRMRRERVERKIRCPKAVELPGRNRKASPFLFVFIIYLRLSCKHSPSCKIPFAPMEFKSL